MSQLINQSELLKRAVVYVSETLSEHPERDLLTIIDDAGMRFNLSPTDSEGLRRLFSKDKDD